MIHLIKAALVFFLATWGQWNEKHKWQSPGPDILSPYKVVMCEQPLPNYLQ